MLLSKEVEVRWNGLTKKWYEERGYVWTKQNDWFRCDIEDVMKTSPIKVLVKCDYCGCEFEKPYRDLYKQRELVDKDCCRDRKCMVIKSEEVNIVKYGVKTHMKTKESQDHLSKHNRTSWDKVVDDFEQKNLKLISVESDYRNDRSRLKFICNNHSDKGIQETNYMNIKNQKHCCKYGGTEAVAIAKRIDGQKVYDDFVKYNLIPQFNPSDYAKNDIPLPYICPQHKDKGIQYRQYSNLAYSVGCEYCASERRKNALKFDIDTVIAKFDEKGLILVGEYKNKEEKVAYRCKKHLDYIQFVTLGGLVNTKEPCLYCREERNICRLSKAIRSTLTWWRKYSRKMHKNKCMLTGLSGNIEVHHQYQLDNIIKDALLNLNIDIKNKYTCEEIVKIKEEVKEIHKKYPIGICLNKELHILFHIEYGRKDCNGSNVGDFIDNYFKGKYDNQLEDKLKSVNSKRTLEEAKKLASFYYVEN